MVSGIITLTTDFGLTDAYVAMMKGAILCRHPAATIIDITHDIEPHQLVQAAITIDNAYRFFPRGTVHVVVVDPGVGTARAALAIETSAHIFIAPDNGVLTRVAASNRVDACHRLENTRLFRADVSRTFHGRDVFAPVAARVAAGDVDLSDLGPPLAPDRMRRLDFLPVRVGRDGLTGAVLIKDRFGNLTTNIAAAVLEKFADDQACRFADIRVTVGRHGVTGVRGCYGEVSIGSPLALIGSSDYLEVAVNQGDAGMYFGAATGDPVVVTIDEKGSAVAH